MSDIKIIVIGISIYIVLFLLIRLFEYIFHKLYYPYIKSIYPWGEIREWGYKRRTHK